MKLHIIVLPGDGIGPEVTKQAVAVLQTVRRLRIRFSLSSRTASAARRLSKDGTPLPEQTLSACLDATRCCWARSALAKFDGVTGEKRPEAGLLALRQALGGYANLRPVKAYDAIADCSPLREEVTRGADILIVRELLGGLYFGQPRALDEDGIFRATTPCATAWTKWSAWRTLRFRKRAAARNIVTSVDKANVLETSQLWRRTVTAVAQTISRRASSSTPTSIRSPCNWSRRPSRYDVVLTENLFGDILSDEAAVISGSLGMLASASIGGKVELYEPVHGSAPDIAGQGHGESFWRHPIGRDVAATIRRALRRGGQDHAVGGPASGARTGDAGSRRPAQVAQRFPPTQSARPWSRTVS